jgi:tetratricopeptide (TPR) repeat protein
MTTVLDLRHRLVIEARELAKTALGISGPLIEHHRATVRQLAYALMALGDAFGAQSLAGLISAHSEAYELFVRIGDGSQAKVLAYNLGIDYAASGQRDRAERWFGRCLELTDVGDYTVRARCLEQLGLGYVDRARTELERRRLFPRVFFWKRRRSRQTRLCLLRAAFEHLSQALALCEENDARSLACINNGLGHACSNLKDYPLAISHYKAALHFDQLRGEHEWAGDNQCEIAELLARTGKFEAGLEYARAALASYGKAVSVYPAAILRAEQLIKALGRSEGPGIQIILPYFHDDDD